MFARLLVKYKRAVSFVVIALMLILTLSFIRNLARILDIQKQVAEKERKLLELSRENESIKKRLEEVNSQIYIEKQLRDNLGLAKEGEIIIILPDESTLRSLAPKLEEEESALPDPNWKKWLYLFFGKSIEY